MNKEIGFIGTGNMGLPIARNLIHAGFALTVYNRTAEKAKELVNEGAKLATKPTNVITSGATIITMLANDQALEEIVFGQNGIAAALGPNEIHISMSTVAPTTTRKIYEEHKRKGTPFIAAPVFGRPDAAAAKKLWICTAGASDTKNKVKEILQSIGQGIYDYGEEPSAANVVKLSGNFLIMAAMEAMGETFAYLEKNGLDSKKFAEMISQTLFSCPVYQNYSKIISNHSFTPAGFKLPLGMKDVNLLLQSASDAKVPMPIASLIHNRFLSAVAKGRENMDWSAIALNSAEDAGLNDKK